MLALLVRASHPALVNLDDEGPYPVLLVGKAGTFTHLSAGHPAYLETKAYHRGLRQSGQADTGYECDPIASATAVQQQMASGLIKEIAVGDQARVAMLIMIYTLARRTQGAMRGVVFDLEGWRIFISW